jgi:hypothetical protein
MFSNYNLTASHFVYNSSGGTTTATGWFSSKASDVVISLCCATLTSNSITYRIEGKFTGSDRVASIDSGTISTANPTVSKLIKVNYPTSQIRLGLKVPSTVASPSASPTNIYADLFLRELK